ncbi:expressed unknown protein [Seminavis robusta]|uniref:Uncharacterized protein n=1 Tax=Seminavis robusta TaxID=568900 RepID=A0A9N8HI88_9STRA|nr:expressed unknown protein [Seminavis robusta]|eukprot:Sro609_g174960.1 n/a (265) ;mRNA; f:13206-14000
MMQRKNLLYHQIALVLLFFFSLTPLLSRALAPTLQADSEKGTADDGLVSVYRIVEPTGATEVLPASYVKSFSRWTLDDGGTLIPLRSSSSHEEGECDADLESTITKIIVRPTLNVILRPGAIPAYVAVGLLVVGDHNNHLAQQWTSFQGTSHAQFRVELFWGGANGSDQRVGVVPPGTVRKALEQFGVALATTTHEKLQDGFHIVSVPLQMQDMSAERPTKDATWFTCLALTTQEAVQVLQMDPAQVQTLALSKLQVEAAKVLV